MIIVMIIKRIYQRNQNATQRIGSGIGTIGSGPEKQGQEVERGERDD